MADSQPDAGALADNNTFEGATMKKMQNLQVDDVWGCVECRHLDNCPIGKALLENTDFCIIKEVCEVAEQAGEPDPEDFFYGPEIWDSEAFPVPAGIHQAW